MSRQLQRFLKVAQLAVLYPVDVKVTVGEIRDVEIIAFWTESYAFGEPTGSNGADLADLSSFCRKNVEERIRRRKPRPFGCATAPVYRNCDGERSFGLTARPSGVGPTPT